MRISELYDFESKIYDYLYGDFLDDLYAIQDMYKGGDVLEIFSGTGRLISNFERGVGIDINPYMLTRTRNKFSKVLGDAFFLPFKRRFDFIIIALNSLLMFNDQDKAKILSEANRVLKDDGGMYIDIINYFSLVEDKYTVSDYRGKDLSVKLEMYPERIGERYDLHYSYIFSRPARTKVAREITIYPIDEGKLQELLDACGFTITKKYGDYDLSPFNDRSDKIIVHARKIRNI